MARHARRSRSPRAVLLLGALVGIAAGCALVALAAVPLPRAAPSLQLSLPGIADAPVGRLPYPLQGEAAVSVPLFGVTYASPDQRAVPIASLTKLMAAYVTLSDLPLRADAPGPTWVVTPEDVEVYRHDQQTDQSSVKVVAGEVLTERELLEGALVRSASNYADMLGELVAGTDDQMVADMNTAARALGLTDTSYADVSGFDPKSVSSARDQLALAARLMRNPVFAGIVAESTVTLPVAGTVSTYTPDLGLGGVVGIKSGLTSQAAGCDAMARMIGVGGHRVLVLAVVLGQRSSIRPDLAEAGHASLALTAAIAERLHAYEPALAGRALGTIGWPGRAVAVVAAKTVLVPSFDPHPARSVVEAFAVGVAGVAAGRAVARLVVTSGALRETTTIVVRRTLSRPSLWQRLR